ncbi:MAG: hypothetical protein Q9211_001526 [Gyalolechia sp. 1 TL-2023]
MTRDAFLDDFPAFTFCRQFLEPPRTVDIPAPQKYELANYLRRTAEATYFDWYQRWMPEQADLIMLDGPDQLDLPAWVALLKRHYESAPEEAFGCKMEFWAITASEPLRHKAVHREDFTTDVVLSVVRVALGLNDVQRAEKVQEAVKSLYDDLCSGVEPGCNFIDVAPNPRIPLKPKPGQFRMLYSVLDLVCRILFESIRLKIPDAFPNSCLEQLEFCWLQAQVDESYHRLIPGKVGRHYICRLTWGCRTLRNCVEHRNIITAKAARSLVIDAANLMLAIGDTEAAREILRAFQQVSSEISNITPDDDLPRPVLFLRRMEQLACWRERSCQGLSGSCSQDLIVRNHHPYRHCLQPIIEKLEGLIKEARREEANWSQTERLYEGHFPKFERGLYRAYGLTARWYDRIKTGDLDIEQARSPTVDYWDGKLGKEF